MLLWREFQGAVRQTLLSYLPVPALDQGDDDETRRTHAFDPGDPLGL